VNPLDKAYAMLISLETTDIDYKEALVAHAQVVHDMETALYTQLHASSTKTKESILACQQLQLNIDLQKVIVAEMNVKLDTTQQMRVIKALCNKDGDDDPLSAAVDGFYGHQPTDSDGWSADDDDDDAPAPATAAAAATAASASASAGAAASASAAAAGKAAADAGAAGKAASAAASAGAAGKAASAAAAKEQQFLDDESFLFGLHSTQRQQQDGSEAKRLKTKKKPATINDMDTAVDKLADSFGLF
jgi:hypothetical protein